MNIKVKHSFEMDFSLKNNKKTENLYQTGKYIKNHPSLHGEDSSWKADKIIPFIDTFVAYNNNNEVNLLDVGGGAGLILSLVSKHIETMHGIKVNKMALDLSQEMLERQKIENPDLIKCLHEDVRNTSLNTKEIDLTLLIDVLEHVPEPEAALEEVRRFSKFVIFKIPLEYNLYARMYNFVKKEVPRQRAIETIGHVNIYDFKRVKRQIEKHTGPILNFCFTNVFAYYNKSGYYRKTLTPMDKFVYLLASYIYKMSPPISAFLFTDFVMILARCN